MMQKRMKMMSMMLMIMNSRVKRTNQAKKSTTMVTALRLATKPKALRSSPNVLSRPSTSRNAA